MRTLLLEESLSTVTLPEELVSAALDILKSNMQFAPDSECALLFTQKIREITMQGDVSPMAIVIKVLTLYSRDIDALCCKHEARLSLSERLPDEVIDTGLIDLSPTSLYLN